MEQLGREVIHLSKKKLVLVVLASGGFVLLGVALLLLDASTIRSASRFDEPLVVRTVGVAAVAFFGAAGAYGIKRLFDDAPGLVLDREGVLDHSSSLGAGRIPWSDVVAVRTVDVHGQRLLVVNVREPRTYLERGGWFERRARKMNDKLYGSPVVIASTALAVDFDGLVATIERYVGNDGMQT